MTVSFKKLQDGSWGISGPGLVEGQPVTVTKKGGDTSEVLVGDVVYTADDGYTIATFSDLAPARTATARRASAPRGNRTYECDECGDYVTPGTVCWETGCRH